MNQFSTFKPNIDGIQSKVNTKGSRECDEKIIKL